MIDSNQVGFLQTRSHDVDANRDELAVSIWTRGINRSSCPVVVVFADLEFVAQHLVERDKHHVTARGREVLDDASIDEHHCLAELGSRHCSPAFALVVKIQK